jgi:hypothetical protein
MANVTLWPDARARLRSVVRRHALLVVDGNLQREGVVVNVIAREVAPASSEAWYGDSSFVQWRASATSAELIVTPLTLRALPASTAPATNTERTRTRQTAVERRTMVSPLEHGDGRSRCWEGGG